MPAQQHLPNSDPGLLVRQPHQRCLAPQPLALCWPTSPTHCAAVSPWEGSASYLRLEAQHLVHLQLPCLQQRRRLLQRLRCGQPGEICAVCWRCGRGLPWPPTGWVAVLRLRSGHSPKLRALLGGQHWAAGWRSCCRHGPLPPLLLLLLPCSRCKGGPKGC